MLKWRKDWFIQEVVGSGKIVLFTRIRPWMFKIWFHHMCHSVNLMLYCNGYSHEEIWFEFNFLLPWIPEVSRKTENVSSGPTTSRPHPGASCSASLWYGNLSGIFGQLKCKHFCDSLHLRQSRNKYITRTLLGVNSQSGVMYLANTDCVWYIDLLKTKWNFKVRDKTFYSTEKYKEMITLCTNSRKVRSCINRMK